MRVSKRGQNAKNYQNPTDLLTIVRIQPGKQKSEVTIFRHRSTRIVGDVPCGTDTSGENLLKCDTTYVILPSTDVPAAAMVAPDMAYPLTPSGLPSCRKPLHRCSYENSRSTPDHEMQ